MLVVGTLFIGGGAAGVAWGSPWPTMLAVAVGTGVLYLWERPGELRRCRREAGQCER